MGRGTGRTRKVTRRTWSRWSAPFVPLTTSVCPRSCSMTPGSAPAICWTGIAGGLFGVGLAENVKQTYGFVVDNYQPGDELFLFGFSRGAHTVRSLSGLIGLLGLLPKQHMDEFPPGLGVLPHSAAGAYRGAAARVSGALPGGGPATEDPDRFHRRLGHGRHHGHSDGTTAPARPAPVPLP